MQARPFCSRGTDDAADDDDDGSRHCSITTYSIFGTVGTLHVNYHQRDLLRAHLRETQVCDSQPGGRKRERAQSGCARGQARIDSLSLVFVLTSHSSFVLTLS